MFGKRAVKKRKLNPWKRSPILNDAEEGYSSSDEVYERGNLPDKKHKFLQIRENTYLDIHTKRAALTASPYVVSLVSYSGDMVLNQGSGTIIESDEHNVNIALTSARIFMRAKHTLADNLKIVVRLSDGRSFEGDVCGYDRHYNIAAIRFKSNSLLQTATLKLVDESLVLNPRQCISSQETSSFRLHRHSNSIKLVPGDCVVAIGRYFVSPYEIMAAPGEFSANHSEYYDCKELLNSTSKMTKCGDGGPLVNLAGEVLGIAFYDSYFTPFLPINMAYKWWEFYKRDGEKLRRPSLGMEATNFYSADLNIAEKIIKSFPSISKGVVVETVLPGSSAESAGLRLNDVIIECAGKVVQSFLEFMEILWDHVGQPVDLVVVRVGLMKLLCLKMMVSQITSDKLNSWPSLER